MKSPKITEAVEDVELPESGGFLEKLAEKLGGAAQASRIFGEPVERDGVTVIPVATARLGFGGGGRKRGLAGRHEGIGGGGGMVIQPTGYIEIKGSETRYRPIVDPRVVIGAGLAAGFLLIGLVKRLRG
jgi:uncharacterized spore protein YtfJ